MKVFGSKMCPDCVEMRKAFDAEGVGYEYFDITEDLKNLKEFLKIRDLDAEFAKIRGSGGIGIPAVQKEDGSWTLDWQSFVKNAEGISKCSDGVCGLSN